MADGGGFDPCECYWLNHNLMMQRLMNLLRNSQDYCTDNQCVSELPGPSTTDGGMSLMMVMLGWIVIATALFLLRPSSLRRRGDEKPHRSQGPREPPTPPPVQ